MVKRNLKKEVKMVESNTVIEVEEPKEEPEIQHNTEPEVQHTTEPEESRKGTTRAKPKPRAKKTNS
jgi:hypothetical protein